MSARSRRNQPAEQMFPGMPDVLSKQPPKASEGENIARTLDEAISRTFEILDEALTGHPIVGTYWLFSGGNDSVVLGHLLRGQYDAILHVNTGTGIPQTTQPALAPPARVAVTIARAVLAQPLTVDGEPDGEPWSWKPAQF